MLLSYACSNFKSFQSTAELRLNAPKGKVRKRFPDNFTQLASGQSLLKEAFVVGENAGGKSNFIESISFLQMLFKTTSQPRARLDLMYDGYIDSLDAHPQTFDLALALPSGTYRYHLALDIHGLIEERLSDDTLDNEVFSTVRADLSGYRVHLADPRYRGTIALGSSDVISAEKFGYGLTVTKLAIAGHSIAMEIVNWVSEKLLVESDPDNDSNEYRLTEILAKPEYLDIFRLIDRSIVQVIVDNKAPFADTILARRDAHGAEYTRRVSDDSSGVREFLKWAALIYEVVYENKTVFADEIDRVMNPVLADRVIAFINGTEHQGQFVFTTHNVLHLSLKTYMKEQIYFATKDRDTLSSSLYSLSEFSDIRYDVKTEMYEFYMRGVLGGTAYE